MSKGGSSSPPQFDVNSAIQQSALANRLDVFSPQGSAVFGGPQRNQLFLSQNPRQAQTQAFGEEAARGLAQRGLGAVSALPGGNINFEGLPTIASEIDLGRLPALPGVGDFSGDASRMEQATFDRARNLFMPDLNERRDETITMLANRGLPVGSEAFGKELNRLDRQQSNLLENAALSAVGAGRQEQSRLFGLGSQARAQSLGEALASAGLGSQARAQGINERVLQRSIPFQELSAMMGGGQSQMPMFLPPPNVDVMGAMGLGQAGQLAAFNNNQANKQATMSGLFGLGNAAILGALT